MRDLCGGSEGRRTRTDLLRKNWEFIVELCKTKDGDSTKRVRLNPEEKKLKGPVVHVWKENS